MSSPWSQDYIARRAAENATVDLVRSQLQQAREATRSLSISPGQGIQKGIADFARNLSPTQKSAWRKTKIGLVNDNTGEMLHPNYMKLGRKTGGMHKGLIVRPDYANPQDMAGIGNWNLATAAKNAKTGYGVIQARDQLDNVIHGAKEKVKDVPILGEVAQAGEDIYQAWMNPVTMPLAPLYSTYRAGSAILNSITGRKESFSPYDYRLTAGNALDRLGKADIPILSPASKLLSYLF